MEHKVGNMPVVEIDWRMVGLEGDFRACLKQEKNNEMVALVLAYSLIRRLKHAAQGWVPPPHTSFFPAAEQRLLHKNISVSILMLKTPRT